MKLPARKIDIAPKLTAGIAIVKPAAPVDLGSSLAQMASSAGTSPLAVMRDFARLAFGPGKLSFEDYRRLSLFDEAFVAGADKRAFTGVRASLVTATEVNYRHDWFGLFAHKVAQTAFLAAHSLPTIPFQAIYCAGISGAAYTLATREALRVFLTSTATYPLFGKPAEGYQSLGSFSAARYDAQSDAIVQTNGEPLALDSLLDDIVGYYGAGYVFQSRIASDPAVNALIGEALPTARIVTILEADGPAMFRACWKIPANGNSADNFWRSGNLLARIDAATGEVTRVISGVGLGRVDVTHHPDTGAMLIGARIPHWDAMKRLALEGARLMRHVPLIGWDIAPAASGALIVEMNETPDLMLNQLADGRGVLDSQFAAFRAFQAQRRSQHMKTVRSANAKL